MPVDEEPSPSLSTLKDSSQQTGQSVGPFTNCTYHATGLFSTVYKYTKTDPFKVLAIKVTTPSQTHPPHNPKREARILAAAAHPYIISILFTQTWSSQFLLVFPFQPCDLNTVLRQGFPLKAMSARHILEGLFRALFHIHSKGIIHRDVKPANILLGTSTGTPFLADFGIAWSPDDPASEASDQKITDVGTTCYRPPELLFGHKAYGPEIDMWAAGCVVAECVRCGLDGSEKPSVKSGEADWTLFDAGELGSELALVKSIFETLGTPTDETWPVSGFSTLYETNSEGTSMQSKLTVTSGSQNLSRLEQNVLSRLPTQIMERRPPPSIGRSSRSGHRVSHVPGYFKTECVRGECLQVMSKWSERIR